MSEAQPGAGPVKAGNGARNAALAVAAVIVVAVLWGRRRSTAKKRVAPGADLA